MRPSSEMHLINILFSLLPISAMAVLESGIREGTLQQYSDGERQQSVVDLTSETFNAAVLTKPHFVMFYAPWCYYSKELLPIWEQVGKSIDPLQNNVQIAKVDCSKYGKLCREHEVRGYPFLIAYKDGTKGTRFNGQRTLEDITEFISHYFGY